MKKIYVSGSKVGVLEVDNVQDKLPVGNYNIQFNSMRGEVYLTTMSDLKMPETEFVDTSIVEKWLKSFLSFDTNLGILLSGLKGAGKTVLAKKLCIKSGLPILHLNSPVPCSELSEFLANPMFYNCIVFIDEFEKIIDQRDEQIASWLKLMDGGFNTKLLFLLTSNGEDVSGFLMNRLSRIKYRKHFSVLSEDTIQKIIDNFLVEKQFEEDLKNTCVKISLLSIDILVNIIQEINLFKEPASEIVKDLNIVNSKISLQLFEKFNKEWKECGFIYADIFNLKGECINRLWVINEKNKLKEKIEIYNTNNNLNSEYIKSLNEEEEKIYSLYSYYEFKNPIISKTKEGYIIKDGDFTFKLVPVVTSNLIF